MKCLAQGHNTALWASNMGPLGHKSGTLTTELRCSYGALF